MQVHAVFTTKDSRPSYAQIFDILNKLPHLQVLTVKRTSSAPWAADAVALPGLQRLKALVAPFLTDLDVDVGVPPAEQVLT